MDREPGPTCAWESTATEQDRTGNTGDPGRSLTGNNGAHLRGALPAGTFPASLRLKAEAAPGLTSLCRDLPGLEPKPRDSELNRARSTLWNTQSRAPLLFLSLPQPHVCMGWGGGGAGAAQAPVASRAGTQSRPEDWETPEGMKRLLCAQCAQTGAPTSSRLCALLEAAQQPWAHLCASPCGACMLRIWGLRAL